MEYKYHPVFKYILLGILVYMFFMHQKSMSQNMMLINSIVITLIIATVDQIIIKDHPLMIYDKKEKFFTEDDIDEIIDSCDSDSD